MVAVTPAAARGMYRRSLGRVGRLVVLRRGATPGQNEAQALARLVGWTPEELASGLMQGERKAIVLAEDLEAGGFPVPVRIGDGLFLGAARLNVMTVDASTRAIGETVIAYELGVKGS